jgi:ribose 5-phosphate isomerase B
MKWKVHPIVVRSLKPQYLRDKLMDTQTETVNPKTVKSVGIAADHGGFELKAFLAGKLRETGYAVTDFGDRQLKSDDDYPDFIIPLARAVSAGTVDRGVGICGSGVGAAIAANKVAGVRAGLIDENFSAHQGVEDDDLNMICLGGLLIGHALAWELVETFLAARFQGAERFRRRLAKVAELDRVVADAQTMVRQALEMKSRTDDYCPAPKAHQLTVREAVAVWRNEGDPN